MKKIKKIKHKDKTINTINKRNKEIALGISIALFLALITVSYAYFIGSFKGTKTSLVSSAGTLELTYTDCVDAEDCADITASLAPGDSVTKTFQIENTGSLDMTYNLLFATLQNSFKNKELVYTLINDTTGESIAYLTPLTYSKGLTTDVEIANEIAIDSGETHKYTLTITFLNTEYDQSDNENALFTLSIGIVGNIKKIKLSDYVTALAHYNITPNFSYAVGIDEGVLTMEDDYGTSYYFRGAVENNYVVFGEDPSYGYYLFMTSDGDYLGNVWYDTLDECESEKTYYEEEYEEAIKEAEYQCELDGLNEEECDEYISDNFYDEEYECVGYPMYWKIIRVNGDGTIRLILDGFADPDSVRDIEDYSDPNDIYNYERYIGESSFNSSEGYMYGDLADYKSSSTSSIYMSSSTSYYFGSSYTYDTSTGRYTLSNTISGFWKNIYSDVISTYKYACVNTSTTCGTLYEITAYSSDTYAIGYAHYMNETTENKYSSLIKEALDTWYEDTFLNTAYESYLADSIFCNDRSVYSGDYGFDDVTYWASYRLSEEYGNYTPQLTCNQKNDAFTVNDTTYGNGDLTYPIGLITADEVAIAGGTTNDYNYYYYLYIDNNWDSTYWTMTPIESDMIYRQNAGLEEFDVKFDSIIKPVINLKADVLISSGDGTIYNPLVLELPT